jgi:CheY-like chemotaxis protein
MGYDLVFAESGTEGVQQATGAKPDLIVLDYRLGDMAGTEALLKIREKQIHAPVVMASGMGSHFIVARAIALGAQEFVSKDDPAFAEKLSDAVRRLVDERAAELMGRLHDLDEARAAGEGAATRSLELALLGDELGFLRLIMQALIDDVVERNRPPGWRAV